MNLLPRPSSLKFLFCLLTATMAFACAKEEPTPQGDPNALSPSTPTTSDVVDNCPGDPLKLEPGVCGCSQSDDDSDNDTVVNCNDACPNDPLKTDEGLCGCGMPETDSDSDGTPDCDDECETDAEKIAAGVCGCGVADTDSDSDGVLDCEDACPDDPTKAIEGMCGCGVADADEDSDGVVDCLDGCTDESDTADPTACGCAGEEADSDGDGAADCSDECPDDALKTLEGECGCGIPDADSDGDGTPDCNDSCRDDPDKTVAGECGCGSPDEDSDADGVLDCVDECPMDAASSEEGACGCGVEEIDTDEDGTPDCIDECPDDPNGTVAADCGCPAGMDGDADSDGVADCEDLCPDDPDKTDDAGDCGCGQPDTADPDGNSRCLNIAASVAHRYSFDGAGTTATDSVGGADGTLVGATQSGGLVTLDGTGYVDLPNGIVSALTDATFEAWFTHSGSEGWERVFDFGESDGGEDAQGLGTSYIFFTPNNGTIARVAFLAPAGTEVMADATAQSPSDTHVVVTIDGAAAEMTLYQNGTQLSSAAIMESLSDINDINNWLGRSQFSADPGLTGTIREFRIYSEVLTAAQVSYSMSAGEDPPWLE